MEELQQHQGEWFFLHELNVDKVFSTIQRADYLILYYIKVEQEAHPGEKLYLADLAAAMGLRVTELSKGIEKLQDSGFVTWKTDREAGRTYVELSSKAVELMAEDITIMLLVEFRQTHNQVPVWRNHLLVHYLATGVKPHSQTQAPHPVPNSHLHPFFFFYCFTLYFLCMNCFPRYHSPHKRHSVAVPS